MKKTVGVFCYYEGRRKTALWRKKFRRQLMSKSRKFRVQGFRVVEIIEYDKPPNPTSSDPLGLVGTWGMKMILEKPGGQS